MGKVITAAADVKAEITSKFILEETFWNFLVTSVSRKAPIGDIAQIEEAREVRAILKAAQEAKSKEITVEDGQFKIISGAVKAYAPTLDPAMAMEILPYLKALEDKSDKNPGGAQKIDLATKK